MGRQLSNSFYYHLTETYATYIESNLHWMVWNPLLHNAELRDGFVSSVSFYTGIPEGSGTLYNLCNDSRNKEDVWERVRADEFPLLPSRKNALFLFDDINAACEANRIWFRLSRDLVRVRIVDESIVHKADSRWLDAYEDEWESAARNYWKGIMTRGNLFPEIVTRGEVYIDLRKRNGEDCI